MPESSVGSQYAGSFGGSFGGGGGGGGSNQASLVGGGGGGGGSMLGGGWTSPSDWAGAFATHYGVDKNIVNMGGGEVDALRSVLASMQESTTPAGMDAIIKAIFKTGFEQEMPKLLGATNKAGIRSGSSSTGALLENDLLARLTGESTKVLQQQQLNTAQMANLLAEQTKRPVVTKVTGEGGISGMTGTDPSIWQSLNDLLGL